MPSISITNLIGGYNVKDYGAVGDGNNDDGLAISRCLQQVTGLVIIPPGTYRCTTTITVPSNIVLLGFGILSKILVDSATGVDAIALEAASNTVIQGLLVDGSRSNNTSGTRHGIYAHSSQDIWIVDCIVKSAIYDGVHLNDCDRVKVSGTKVYDNGRNGIAINYSRTVKLVNTEVFDNCRVSTIGTADNIRIELLSSDNSIANTDAYESSGVLGLAGYGVREASGELVERTNIFGGMMSNNRSGAYSFEDPASVALGV